MERILINPKSLLLLLVISSSLGFAQFNKEIARIYGNYLYIPGKSIGKMGDQNHDGFADFYITDCQKRTFNVYYGGATLDTLPKFTISNCWQMTMIDINGDGDKDIFINGRDSIRIYYGGMLLDTLADITLPLPAGHSYLYGTGTVKNIGDFNGDGFDDILIDDAYPPFSNKAWGCYFIYKGKPDFALVPETLILPDTLNNRYIIDYNNLTYGDLDGDGKSDLIYLTIAGSSDQNNMMSIIKGNATWDTTAIQRITQQTQTFDVKNTRIISDINKDGRADLMIDSYGTWFPEYYTNFIIHGSIPIDTIPDVGLNTQSGWIIEVVPAGDVNHDGYMDLLTLQTRGMSYPIAKLWFGSKNMQKDNRPKKTWGNQEDFYGGLVAGLGDVNGDGIDDFVVGCSDFSHGCVYQYLSIFPGDSTVHALGAEAGKKPEEESVIRLEECYPNPSNQSSRISYELIQPGKVRLVLYTGTGEEVRVLENGEKEKGRYSILFDGRGLAGGIYFIRMEFTGTDGIERRAVKKLNYLK